LLSSRISDYQKRTVNANSGLPTQMAAAPTQSGNLFQTPTDALQTPHTNPAHDLSFDNISNQNMHTAYGPKSINPHGQHGAVSFGGAPDKVHANGLSQSSHTPQQKTAAMQRGSHLIQELGQNLYQHHLASGMVDPVGVDATQFPRTQQSIASPGMAYAPQAQILSATSHVAVAQLDGQLNGESSVSSVNFFHHNLNQARARASERRQPFASSLQMLNNTSNSPQTTNITAADALSAEPQSPPKSPAGLHDPSQGRSFSTGSVPFYSSANQLGGSPVSPLSRGFHQPTTVRTDYENMRRSFSSNVDLTPQHSLLSSHSAFDAVPLKRSLPPASPTIGRKRQRLSLPGQDDAPTLTPSVSMHQLYAPAGLPADDRFDDPAQIAAIEVFEKQNMADLASLSSAPPNIDPGLYTEHNTRDFGPMQSNINHNAHQSIPIDPQLFQDTNTDPIVQPIVQSTEDNTIHSRDQVASKPVPQTPQAPAAPTQGFLDDSSSPLSEPDWSLFNEDAYDAYLQN
jgi:hypothetical protein